ncbi:MAG: CPBP family intramembrane glutamate endopeptidase, partial [Peptoniphilus harei]
MKKDLKIFITISFIIPYIMGFAIYYCNLYEISTSIYPLFQMFIPFLGVIALLHKKDKNILKIAAIRIYLVISLILFVLSIINIFNPEFSGLSEFVILISAIAMIIAISTMDKDLKKKLSLNNPNKKSTLLMCLLFIIIYFFRAFLGYVLQGETNEFFKILNLKSLRIFISIFFFSFLNNMPF